MLPWLNSGDPFPPVAMAMRDPNGLLAVGADLQPATLLRAYRQGIFPWYNEGQPILWWSPDPRMVLLPEELIVRRSLAKRIRNGGFDSRMDTQFAEVMGACASRRPGQDGTWISAAMLEAYTRLHRLGFAHSVETWLDGELVGGLYGVAIGKMFYGESMFSVVKDASKVALAALCRYLAARDFGMIDCQMNTPHLASLGAREISRAAFIQRVHELVNLPDHPGPWHFDHVSV
ncbi:MAG TPA: leucyl/phenylalanyl-tRNA--protein transferase [Thiobacillaceae bacterium]|nr:leucyl/phenylalanyl-tRNA--protein transferase [Thiobacillaceae bacterium]